MLCNRNEGTSVAMVKQVCYRIMTEQDNSARLLTQNICMYRISSCFVDIEVYRS